MRQKTGAVKVHVNRFSSDAPGRAEPGSRFVRQWCTTTFAAALSITVLDAWLLQRSRGIFTGGFLSVDHLETAGAAALFVVLSLVIDAAIAGALAAAAMWTLARLGLRSRAVRAGGFLAALTPLVVADIVDYQLTRYLSAGFDLGLMFDLTGRSIAEIVAVASPQLVSFALGLVLLLAAIAGVIWLINRTGGARVTAAAVPVLPLAAGGGVVAAVALMVAVYASSAMENALLRKPAGQALRAVIEIVSDVDRDGFGALGRFSDPDPWNAGVFPYAVDHPGNGVDENGVGGDLPPGAGRYQEWPVTPGPWTRTPDVLLVVLESFRADVVGARFEERPVTPTLDALAARGVSSRHAFSPNGYTVQSRFHMLAGTLVAAPGTPTLVDDFRSNGYVVGYFSGQDESFGAEEYRVGFDRADVAHDARSDAGRKYSTFATPGSLAIPFQAVEERVGEFLHARGGERRPMFLYVNFEDTHFPYTHDGIAPLLTETRIARAAIAPGEHEALRATYLNTVANLDRAVGALVERIRRVRGREPAVIVTADHGESLFEHGFLGHGYALNDVQTRVPLIAVNLPMRVPDPFSLADLRGVLTAAMAVPLDAGVAPSLQPVERPVFQYLGDLRRPRQIALVRPGARFIYDFRVQRVQTWEGQWLPLPELAAADRDDYLRLIRYWEWMDLARATTAAASGDR